MQVLERNKANVIAFYLMMFNECQPKKAVELYVGDVAAWKCRFEFSET